MFSPQSPTRSIVVAALQFWRSDNYGSLIMSFYQHAVLQVYYFSNLVASNQRLLPMPMPSNKFIFKKMQEKKIVSHHHTKYLSPFFANGTTWRHMAKSYGYTIIPSNFNRRGPAFGVCFGNFTDSLLTTIHSLCLVHRTPHVHISALVLVFFPIHIIIYLYIYIL